MKNVVTDDAVLTFVCLYHNRMWYLKIDSCYYAMLRAVHISAAICCQFFWAQYQRIKSSAFRTSSLPVFIPIRLHWKAVSVPQVNIINCAVSVMLRSSIAHDCPCDLGFPKKIVSISCTCLLFVQVESLKSWKVFSCFLSLMQPNAHIIYIII